MFRKVFEVCLQISSSSTHRTKRAFFRSLGELRCIRSMHSDAYFARSDMSAYTTKAFPLCRGLIASFREVVVKHCVDKKQFNLRPSVISRKSCKSEPCRRPLSIIESRTAFREAWPRADRAPLSLQGRGLLKCFNGFWSLFWRPWSIWMDRVLLKTRVSKWTPMMVILINLTKRWRIRLLMSDDSCCFL